MKGGRDVVVFLSHGGGTRECVDAAAELVRRGVVTLAITSNQGNNTLNNKHLKRPFLFSISASELSRLALASLTYSTKNFAEPFQLMPTSTIVVQVFT